MRYWDPNVHSADLTRRPPLGRGGGGLPYGPRWLRDGRGPGSIPPNKVLYDRPTPGDIVCGFFAVFPPPLAAFIVAGRGRDFWINVALTLAGYLPGVIHAMWLIARR